MISFIAIYSKRGSMCSEDRTGARQLEHVYILDSYFWMAIWNVHSYAVEVLKIQ
jgi:hypothetical protein